MKIVSKTQNIYKEFEKFSIEEYKKGEINYPKFISTRKPRSNYCLE